MDERLAKAYDVANYMATLSNQKRIIKEELNQQLVYYIGGSYFKVDSSLIAFTKTVMELGHTTNVVFLDANQTPVIIEDVESFLQDLVDVYFEALNAYSNKTLEIRSKRKLTDIISL